MGIRIEIEAGSDGEVNCISYMTDGDALDGKCVMLAMGMLEVAKAALVNGRWGVMDSKRKKAKGVSMVPVVEEYIKARIKAETGDKP